MTSLAPLMQYLVKPMIFKFVNEGDKSSFFKIRTVLHYIDWNEYLLQWNLCNHYTVFIIRN